MKKIGEGYFYNVYDRGDGRVVKHIKSKWDRFFTISKLCLLMPTIIYDEFSRSERDRATFEDVYKILKTNLKDWSVLGNPLFLDGVNYEQDLVIPIARAFKSATIERQKEIIDSFIECISMCWRQGFSEHVFNFTINNGVDKNGNVVLLDFNEISFDKEDALLRIQNKRWLRAASYKRWAFSKELCAYYEKRMEESLTEENLNRYWSHNY